MTNSLKASPFGSRLLFDLLLGAFLFGLFLIVWLPAGSAAKSPAPSPAPISVLPGYGPRPFA